MKKILWLALLFANSCGRMISLHAQSPTTPVVIAATVACATSIDGTVVGLPNPLNPPVVAAAYTGTLPAGNYYVQIGWYDAAAHNTLVGPEVSVQLTGTGEIQVNLPTSGIPSGAVGMNVYISASSGTETLQGQTTGAATFTQSTALTSGAAVPSTNNTVCAIAANDAGWPTGTGYQVSMTTPAGSTVPGFPMQWQILGPGSTYNLSYGYPLYNGTVTYGSTIQARPYNHAAQSISGPLSMTGYAITQVLKLGVGTSVPGWPIDVENGSINASTGFIYNGGAGVVPGVCLVAGSDPYKTFTPSNAPCITSGGLYYQTADANGTALTQRPVLNFASRFAVNDSSSPAETTVDLANVGTAGTYTSPVSVTFDQWGRETAVTAGSAVSRTCNSNGCYRIEADGTIEQWGSLFCGSTSCSITFPHAFTTTTNLAPVATINAAQSNLTTVINGISTTAFTAETGGVVFVGGSGGSYTGGGTYTWFAIGN